MKRVSRVWGKRLHGGWVIWKPSLLNELRFSDYVQFGDVTVSSKELKEVLRNGIETQDCLLRINGGLQVEEVRRYLRTNPFDPRLKQTAHRLSGKDAVHLLKPLKVKEPDGVGVIVVIKPKKYG